MTKGEFRKLFDEALAQAASHASKKLGRDVPSRFSIRLHGAGSRGDIVDVDSACDALYLGADRFYRIIDLAVVEVTTDECVVFARASDHEPSPFEETWNDPPGSGPFKQILAEEISVHGM